MPHKNEIIKILNLIEKAYGKPRVFKASDPLDELIRTVLSQNTSDKNSLAAFAVLKSKYKKWDDVLKTSVSRLALLIKHAGLSNIKARRIKEILLNIRKREGKTSLGSLKDMDTDNAMAYLTSLKGVGPKTASCVLLFSFNKPVMPVDTHIYRVTKRLGIISQNTGIEDAHKLLSNMVPNDLIYGFHLGIIEHGRKTCKAQNPRCWACVLYDLCKFKYKALHRKRKV